MMGSFRKLFKKMKRERSVIFLRNENLGLIVHLRDVVLFGPHVEP